MDYQFSLSEALLLLILIVNVLQFVFISYMSGRIVAFIQWRQDPKNF